MSNHLPFARPFTLAEARDLGVSRAVVRGWAERGLVRRIGHGLFAPTGDAGVDGVRITQAVSEGRVGTSYAGAARLHGLLLPFTPHPLAMRAISLKRIPVEHLYRSGRVLLAGPAWTAVTLARYQDLASALVPLDSALRARIPRHELADCAEHMRGWPGAALLARAVACADSRSESALESLARGRFIEAGLPLPVLQKAVLANHHRYRLDMCWPKHKLVLEIDGAVKYENAGVMLDEKRRHNDLQAAGFTVLRCGFVNLHPHAEALIAQLRRLLAVPATEP